MLNVTFLAFYEDSLLAYITLSTDNIKLKNLGENYKAKFKGKNVIYSYFPAITVGRLAVDTKYQKLGIGNFMIEWAVMFCLNISKKVAGVRFIKIDSHIEAIKFYEKNHFKIVPNKEKTVEKELKKYEQAKRVNDIKTANTITIPMYRDLYREKE
ncbi:GNAT family N-acetyltransferase [Methanobrevibacter filiformis]|uniref:Acetyltransferase (GNAT) family protein n=1 Tax=Methanobrevibacter filiformis TaxID=55758 RepID=A0A166EVK7_9EURY|nr:GNAT family N-acetyltransferase [Methanobrevibacter filiformis]KZX17063.1 acetyltransferase (GNAT) family protein [Methanobrevibacter filiformis]